MKKKTALEYLDVTAGYFDMLVKKGIFTADANGDFTQESLDAYKADKKAQSSTLATRPITLPVSLNSAPPQATEPPQSRHLSYVPIHHRLTLSIDEAAALAGVSRAAIVRAIAAGELAAFTNVARGRRIRRADLQVWVDGWE